MSRSQTRKSAHRPSGVLLQSNRSVRAIAAASFTSLLAITAAHAGYGFPDTITIDRLGVSIGALVYERSETFLTIGDPAQGGLAWTFDGHLNDPYSGSVTYWRSPASAGAHVQVKLAGAVTQFVDCESNACKNWSGTAATLQKTAMNWIFTAGDGSIYTFDITDSISSANQYYPVINLGKLLTIQRPAGELISINRVSAGSYAIQSVVSSRGYALKYEGGGLPSSVSIINLANHTCTASITTCDGVDESITLTYPSNSPWTITDAAGRQWLYRIADIPSWQDPRNPIDWGSRDSLIYFKSPDGYEMSTTYDVTGRLTRLTDNRGNWNYTYPDETLAEAKINGSTHTIEVRDPTGALLYTSLASLQTPVYVRDANNNATVFSIPPRSTQAGGGSVTFRRLEGVKHQEGNSRNLTFDARGNITVATDTPKAISGQAVTTMTASYPATCTNPKTCNKPTSETDAKGNVTNYTYDASHGGVLSVMGPAPTAGAARPLKLTSYVQKTPYYRNPSGVMTASSTPIWVVSTETECQTAAGSSSPVCDASAASKVTTYEYGATGTANALWPRGIAVASGGVTLRSCFTYDNLGRKLSETKPMANLAVCP